jgi:hypothetical protein
MLTASVPDSPDQTRQVLLAHAASVNGETAVPDFEPFVALQRWLDLAGEHRVTIRYASALAMLVPPGYVRMRRDFRQALTVIQSIAVLHQCQRQRDAEGRIIAELEDYRIARELLLDCFTAAATGGITATVRASVEALRSLLVNGTASATVKAVGDVMGVQKDTAWNRVRKAIDLGFIRNEETRRGQPAKLVLGDPLPEDRPALPTVEEVQLFMCSDPPEPDSTVQPLPSDSVQPESKEPVESAVEPDVQPSIQPLLVLESDSESSGVSGPVERLNGERKEQHTSTRTDHEGDRVFAFALAKEIGFPQIRLGPGVTVMAGEECWHKFVASARADFLRTAIERLEAHDPG